MTDTLLDGYQRFRTDRVEGAENDWRDLATGQSPRAMVIACSDSRVDPATIFDTAPGEIFVVRNVANLVPPQREDGGRHGVEAAVEYAVTQLKVPELVVMGHEGCGGVQAALTRCFHGAAPGEGGHVSNWVDPLSALAERVSRDHGTDGDAGKILERSAIRQSLQALRDFDFVRKAEDKGELKLTGYHFSISEGRLYRLDEGSGEYHAQ